MALSIGVKAGSKIQVGESIIKVKSIPEMNRITLTVDDNPREFEIRDDERTEILPEVYVSCGKQYPDSHHSYSRLAFEAPYRIPIWRVPN